MKLCVFEEDVYRVYYQVFFMIKWNYKVCGELLVCKKKYNDYFIRILD